MDETSLKALESIKEVVSGRCHNVELTLFLCVEDAYYVCLACHSVYSSISTPPVLLSNEQIREFPLELRIKVLSVQVATMKGDPELIMALTDKFKTVSAGAFIHELSYKGLDSTSSASSTYGFTYSTLGTSSTSSSYMSFSVEYIGDGKVMVKVKS